MSTFTWQDRRDLQEGLRSIKACLDGTLAMPDNAEETLNRVIEVISELANKVDSQTWLLNNYKAVLRDSLSS